MNDDPNSALSTTIKWPGQTPAGSLALRIAGINICTTIGSVCARVAVEGVVSSLAKQSVVARAAPLATKALVLTLRLRRCLARRRSLKMGAPAAKQGQCARTRV